MLKLLWAEKGFLALTLYTGNVYMRLLALTIALREPAWSVPFLTAHLVVELVTFPLLAIEVVQGRDRFGGIEGRRAARTLGGALVVALVLNGLFLLRVPYPYPFPEELDRNLPLFASYGCLFGIIALVRMTIWAEKQPEHN